MEKQIARCCREITYTSKEMQAYYKRVGATCGRPRTD